MKREKRISVGLILIFFAICCLSGCKKKATLADDFEKDQLKKITTHALDFKVPKAWDDVSEEDEIKYLKMDKEDDSKIVAGCYVKYLGTESSVTDDNDEITKDVLKEYIGSDSTNVKHVKTIKYNFDGANKQKAISYEDKEEKQEWNNYSAIVTCDGVAFHVWFYAQKDLDSEDAAKKFFDTINLSDYVSPRKLIKISATYDGSTIAGTEISEDNTSISVTAHFDDGTTEYVADWGVSNPSVLKADKTTSYKITYLDKSCNLKIRCTTITKAKYKSKCKSYGYTSIARYPEKYEGKYIKVYGKVIQSLNDTYRIAMNGNYDHIVYVTASGVKTAGKILEDDMVTVYGKCSGETTYESVMGASITLPSIEAKYISR